MLNAAAIARIEQELSHIGRAVSNIGSGDYEAERDVHASLDFIRTALRKMMATDEDVPAGITYPAAA